MGAKAIPEVGQRFLGDKPATRKLLHVSFGVSSASPDVAVAETATYTLVDLTVPAVITNVWTQVEEAFTTSVTADIGDSDDVDRYTSDTTIVSASSGAVLVASTGLAVPYLTATSPLDIEVVIGGATVAAGLAHVYVEYYELQD
jgi:hypothetical protein